MKLLAFIFEQPSYHRKMDAFGHFIFKTLPQCHSTSERRGDLSHLPPNPLPRKKNSPDICVKTFITIFFFQFILFPQYQAMETVRIKTGEL